MELMEGDPLFEEQKHQKKLNYKFILSVIVGMVLVGGAAAFASAGGSKSFLARFGRASVATINDVAGKDDFKLAAEVELIPKLVTSEKTIGKKETTPAQNKISSPTPSPTPKTDITSSIFASVTNSQIVAEIKKIPEEIMVATTSAVPPPVSEISTEPTSTPTSTEPLQGQQKPILIYIVQISGPTGTTTEDFISLFNPNNREINISDWKLRKKTKTQSDYTSIRVFPDDSIIPAKGKFVWASSKEENFYLTVDATVTSTQTIAVNNSVALLNKDNNIIDAVAWGEGLVNPYIEGNPVPNPEVSLARRLDRDFMPIDTNDNLSDFEIK